MSAYNYGYRDFEQNFPDIFSILRGTADADLESFRQPVGLRSFNKRSRTSVKRTAKKQAGMRRIHELEKHLPQKPDYMLDKTLVLRFVGHRGLGYIADTNKGRIGVLWLPHKRLWVCGFANKQGRLCLASESKKSYKDALAKLCGLQWASFILGDGGVSLYELYREIYFDFSDSKDKKPRNNTISLRADKQFHPIWSQS